MSRRLAVSAESWPIRGGFTISRGTRTEARVVVAEIAGGGATGRGECVPYAHYGETVEGVIAAIEGLGSAIAEDLDRAALQAALPAGAARNALDCALWDLEAKLAREPVWRLAGLPEPAALVTAYTLGLGSPGEMAKAARENASRPLLKIKLGADGVLERLGAIHAAAPDSRLIVDANEAWTPDLLARVAPGLAALGVEMIEQPLPAGKDDALAGLERPVPICADESCHDRSGLDRLAGRYDMINIKLDKAGGLTEALALAGAAEAAGYGIMVGCMIGTSLAMAPAMLVAQRALFTDLDGPLILDSDREPGIVYRDSVMEPVAPALWG